MEERKFIQEIISNELEYCFKDCSQDNIDKWVEILNRYKKQLFLNNVRQQRELLRQYNSFVNMKYHSVELDDTDITEKLLNLFSDNNYLKSELKEEKKRKLLEDLIRLSQIGSAILIISSSGLFSRLIY